MWPVFAPYIALYRATVMFYWWPLARLYRLLWFIYGGLFVVAPILNVTSHHRPEDCRAGTPVMRSAVSSAG